VEKGKLIVSTKGRKGNQNLEFVSRNNKPDLDLPMVILINQGSASGSEIVAACLKDYQRAIIVGEKSFGKGSVQTVVPLGDGSALRLTTSKYFSPLGKEIHGKGVLPDIAVEEGRIELALSEEPSVEKPQDIFRELEKKEKKLEEQKSDYKSDNQLMQAVDILKAVKIYKQIKK
jgi:carboxyl-terminal processing protease